jgi:hypothetical protein
MLQERQQALSSLRGRRSGRGNPVTWCDITRLLRFARYDMKKKARYDKYKNVFARVSQSCEPKVWQSATKQSYTRRTVYSPNTLRAFS